MKWCCAQFHGWFQEAGSRGFSVFGVATEKTEPAFLLQHRCIPPDIDPPAAYEVPHSIVSEIAILFCPWCGVRLTDWYRDCVAELDRSDLRIRM